MIVESPMLSILDKIEELRQFMTNPTELDLFIMKLERLDALLPRLAQLDKLMQRIDDIESELYMFKDYWTVSEAAKYLDVHKSRIYRLSSEQEISTYKPNERVLYIKKADIDAWLEQFRVKSSREIYADAELRAKKYEMEHNKNNYR